MFQKSLKFKTWLLLTSVAILSAPVFAQDQTTAPQAPAQEEGELTEEDQRRLDAVVVRGRFIPNEKRATSEISSLLDSEDFRVTGDPDAASALRRVTGLTISRGKFVFVRGLNERYTSAVLNGSPLPSPEPLRRVAPLDLFPTGILDSVLVQKTWSPEYSAEFGGGVIDLRTKSVPEDGFFNIGVSGTITAIETFQDGLLFEGGGRSDFTGFDDGTRDLPPELAAVFTTTRVTSLPVEDNAAIGAALITPELSVVQEGLLGPEYGINLNTGYGFDITPDISVGFTGSAGFSNGWETRRGFRREVNALNINPDGTGGILGGEGVETTLTIDDDFERESTENVTRLNGLITLGLQAYDAHDLSFTALITRSTAKEVRVFEGEEDDIGNDIREENFEFFERQLFTLQGRGEHELTFLGGLWNELDDFTVNWRASYSEAFRDAPFQNVFTFEDTGPEVGVIDGEFQLEDSDDVNITFSTIDDDVTDVGVDLKLPLSFDWLPGNDVEINAGYAYLTSNRDTFIRIFNFGGDFPLELQPLRVDLIFNESTVTGDASTGFVTEEVGGSEFPEAFAGELELDAYYVSGDIRVSPNLRIAGGLRYEDSLQTSDTFNVTLPDNGIVEAQLSSRFLLPSVTVTWNFAENLQLRGAFSQTITRPQFRELALVQFINPETDELFAGNPFLINSQVDNYDARLEWYFANDQFVTLGFFYKDLENPIEEVGDSSIDSPINSFINAPSAQIFGFEFELDTQVPLYDWLGWSWLRDRDFVFKTNYSFTDSEVSSNGDVITASFNAGAVEADIVPGEAFILDGRSLQGQSDHIFNAQFGYDNDKAGTQFRILFNFASDRIRTTESLVANQPAIVESPPLSLDFTFSKQFEFLKGNYTFGINARNLTGANYDARQSGTENSIIVDQFDRGQEFSFSLKRSF